VQNINPNQVTLRAGGSRNVKMVVIVSAVDAPNATCDPGEISAPTKIALKMVDYDGNELINNGKITTCKGGDAEKNIQRTVLFQSPLNCGDGVIKSTATTLTVPGLLPNGAAPYEEDTKIKCFE
jgi:hypothetical protein